LTDGRAGKWTGWHTEYYGLQARRTNGRTDGQSRASGQADAKKLELEGGQLTPKFGGWTALASECVDPIDTWC
jgi:hypothetical protein